MSKKSPDNASHPRRQSPCSHNIHPTKVRRLFPEISQVHLELLLLLTTGPTCKIHLHASALRSRKLTTHNDTLFFPPSIYFYFRPSCLVLTLVLLILLLPSCPASPISTTLVLYLLTEEEAQFSLTLSLLTLNQLHGAEALLRS
jgi:hypothetical protein